jgi:hypothetical protein
MIEVPVSKRNRMGVAGFVETDKHVAIEAPHFDRAVGSEGVEWRRLEDFGPLAGGVTAFPVTAKVSAPGGVSPRIEYDVFLFSTGELNVELQCAPSLDFTPGEPLRVAVSFDDEKPKVVELGIWTNRETWQKAVSENLRRVVTKHRIDRAGPHVLKVWRVTPGVVLERIVIDAGGVKPSYLGAPESPRVGK